jgi:copper transport protein
MLRILGGLLITLGLFEHTSVVDQNSTRGPLLRWLPSSASAFGLGGLVVGELSFAFDGHTTSKGPRVIHAIVDVVHVGAGGIWVGGVISLAVVATMRRHTGQSVAPVLLRFFTVAAAGLIVVTAAGALMSVFIVDGLRDYIDTDWGQLLLIKVGAVLIAAGLGGHNHYKVLPATQVDADEMAATARKTIAAESVVLLAVLVITVFLTVASTN